MDTHGQTKGVEEREAHLCLQDADLWPFLDVGSLSPVEREEVVNQCTDAAKTLN
jgi:hypothetical protein